MITNLHLDAQRFRACFHHRDGLRMAAFRYKHHLAIRFASEGKTHRLRRCRSFIEQGCVRHIQSSKIRNHRLEIQQCLQATLRDLRLIRCVGRVPTGIFQNIALNHRRRVCAVVALTDEGFFHFIFPHDTRQALKRLDLR